MSEKLRPIAIYLPQFHEIPENNEWWGDGFTEWVTVKKAIPQFKGHYQPHVPSELGYYDLVRSNTIEAQASLAKEHGIHGFCYYHYWFNGKRLLDAPVQKMIETSVPDLPFMLCWANENWTRTWDGREKNILIAQQYSEEDDRDHIRHLIPFFKDPRYIKVNDKPVICIYKSFLLPDPSKTISIFREEAKKEGLELYICRFENHGHYGETYMKGFDAAIDFQPFGENFPAYNKLLERRARKNPAKRILFKFFDIIGWKKPEDQWVRNYYQRLDYNDFAEFSVTHGRREKYKIFPGIFPNWDNTARRGADALIFKNSTPASFKAWLQKIVNTFKPYSKDENFIFINAWNEWAEGNHLEPDEKWGRGYLEAVKKVMENEE